MEKERIIELYHKYVGHSCTQQERREFHRVLLDPQWNELLKEVLDGELLEMGELSDVPVGRSEKIFQRIVGKGAVVQRKVRSWRKLVAVAAILAVVFAVGLWYVGMFDKQEMSGIYTSDVDPGRTGATLTLADGRKILLADALAGNIAEEAGVRISKDKDGQLVYTVVPGTVQPGDKNFNTLSTIRGEQVQLRLPDGSLVFLNAASSLRYPVNFKGKGNREVVLDGEGYFEVVKDSKHPFIVSTSRERIQVLGTHFNVNAYRDEAASKTTLLEGSVKVAGMGTVTSRVLVPGQQATFVGGRLSVATVEVDDVVDWKDGYFIFNKESLESIMRRLARWYNVEVEYGDEEMKALEFSGSVSRFGKISAVLAKLELAERVNFKVEGRKVIVSKR